MTKQIRETLNQEETIDLREMVIKYLKVWYYFLFCIILSLCITTLYLKFTKPIFSVSTKLLIRDDDNSQFDPANLIEGLELFSVKRNLKNEIVILNSYSLTNKVIEDLGLGISYYGHKFMQKDELYKTSPFNVIVNSIHPQIADVDFEIELLSSDSFRLQVKNEHRYAYDVKFDKYNRGVIAETDIDKVYKFNELIDEEFFSFKLVRITDSLIEKRYLMKRKNYDKYSFKLNYRSKLVRAYIKNINISPINKETSVLLLSIKSKTPDKNIDFLNKLTELYIESGLQEKNMIATNTIRFIGEQLSIITDSLSVTENRIEEFGLENPNIKIADKDYGTFFQSQKNNNELYENSVHLKYYTSLLKNLNNPEKTGGIVSPTSIGINNLTMDKLISQLIQLNSEKEKLKEMVTDKSSIYIAILEQIQFVKQTLVENVEGAIEVIKMKEKNLQERSNKFTMEIDQLPEAEKKFVILKRKYELLKDAQTYLKGKKSEAELAKAGTAADHMVIDEARKDSDLPVSPKKGFSYILALLLGILTPISIMAIRDFFNDTVKTKLDLQKHTSVPILGVLGHNDKANSLFVPKNPKSVIAESFRTIRTNLQYIASEKKQKVIAVTSTVGGEGKTFCSMNLASIFALSGNKTILIGGDLRKPKIKQDFEIKSDIGLSNYLIGKVEKKDVIFKTELQHLNVIPSGPTPPNPAELLESKKMIELITMLKRDYDCIVLDTPPIGLVTDGVVLMKNADISLFVVRHNYTKIKSLSIVNNLHHQKIIQNLNIIINDFSYEDNSYGYGYGYGYGTDGYGYYAEDS